MSKFTDTICKAEEARLSLMEKRGFLGLISTDLDSDRRWCTNNPRSILEFLAGFKGTPQFVIITIDDPLTVVYRLLGAGATEAFLGQALFQARKRRII